MVIENVVVVMINILLVISHNQDMYFKYIENDDLYKDCFFFF